MLQGITYSIMLIAAVLLVLGGVRTVRAPQAVRAALTAQGLRGDSLVGVIACVEIVVGGLAIGGSRIGVFALAIVYVGYAAFVARAARRRISCGCLGQSDAPATWRHATTNAIFAASAATAAAIGAPAVGPIALIALFGLVGLGAILALQVVSPSSHFEVGVR